MILPAPKLFKVIKGVTFDYSFQYLKGVPPSPTVPVDLSSLTGRLVLTSMDGLITYATYTSPGAAGHSGVFFGGPGHDSTTGIIDFIIIAADTLAITWSTAHYYFTLTDTNSVVTALLQGSFGVVGSMP